MTGLTSAIHHPLAMLTEIYIEALLVDEDLADQMQTLLESGLISGTDAALAWLITAINGADSPQVRRIYI